MYITCTLKDGIYNIIMYRKQNALYHTSLIVTRVLKVLHVFNPQLHHTYHTLYACPVHEPCTIVHDNSLGGSPQGAVQVLEDVWHVVLLHKM